MVKNHFIKLAISLVVGWYSCTVFANDDAADTPMDRTAEIKLFFPEATVIGEKQTDVPIIPVYQLQQLLGYVFESNDFVNIQGFSGNRVNMLIGMDVDGKLVGNKVIEHQEPIFLHGLGDPPLQKFVKQFVGPKVNNRIRVDSKSKAAGSQTPNTIYIDGISRATISAIVINDTILSSSLKVARQMLDEFAQAPALEVKLDYFEKLTWAELLEQGYVKHWSLTRTEVEKALNGKSLDSFADNSLDLSQQKIDIYYAYLNTPITGRNILGDQAFHRLFNSLALAPKDHALMVASTGFYSYIEDDFQPGAVPERLSLNQKGLSIPLRDVNFNNSPNISDLPGAPELPNMRIFKIKPQTGFNPGAEIQIQLNMGLRKNHLVKQDVSFTDNYQLPSNLFNASVVETIKKKALWVSIWKSRVVEIVVLLLSLALVSLIFIKQEFFSGLGNKFTPFRWTFLLFTLFFIGYYSQGQLSVVNIFTLLISLFTEFKLDVFLLDPVIFVLWIFTFVSLFLWGRGVFCGWLCPFGVLQEMVAWLATKLSIKQWKISPNLHAKLTKSKFLILLGLVFTSFYSLATAEVMSEIEPFKTAITMNFVRTWPFVVYSVLLLGIGLFINKFYCRYVCPLGAGLAILGKFRRFEKLTRRNECGTPCQTCRHACGVNAIEKNGKIDYDECIQCLECVVIINDNTRCSPQVVEQKRESRSRIKGNIEEIVIVHSS